MSKRLAIQILAAALVAFVLAGAALASTSRAPRKLNAVTISMKDPGCHWFNVGGKLSTKLTVTGGAAIRNIDEAALVVKGAGSVQKIPVGKTLDVLKAGRYHITMVGQAPDDNHLLLVVK